MKKEEAITKAREVHGDKYGYDSLPEAVDYKTRYEIFCVKHQEYFSQNLSNHLSNKRGCPSCAKESRKSNLRTDLCHYQNMIREKYPELHVDYAGYVDTKSDIVATCMYHGNFNTKVANLLKSTYGCPECSKIKRGLSRRKTLEEFLEKSELVHQDRYDYTKVVFEGYQQKVEIVCDIHGSFYQAPKDHVKGHGCPKCADLIIGEKKARKMDDTLFKLLHSQPNVIPFLDTYHRASKNMEFTCDIHGKFSKKPTDISFGFVCSKCNIQHKADKLKLSQEDFIAKAVKVFPDFDYSKVVYTRSIDHIDVTCSKGHSFKVRPANLLNGYGCRQCYINKVRNGLIAKGYDYYIAKAKDLHGDRYDYSKTSFINCKEKAIIGCAIHGDFKCSMDNHIRGKGCPTCAVSGYNPTKAGFFYILQVNDEVIKFGITGDVPRRLCEINKNSCYDITLICSFSFEDGNIPRDIENTVFSDNTIIKGVVSKADMKQGFTETTYLYNLPKILQIIENFTNDPSC